VTLVPAAVQHSPAKRADESATHMPPHGTWGSGAWAGAWAGRWAHGRAHRRAGPQSLTVRSEAFLGPLEHPVVATLAAQVCGH
jgi:hypothetical protein